MEDDDLSDRGKQIYDKAFELQANAIEEMIRSGTVNTADDLREYFFASFSTVDVFLEASIGKENLSSFYNELSDEVLERNNIGRCEMCDEASSFLDSITVTVN